VGLIDEIEMNR